MNQGRELRLTRETITEEAIRDCRCRVVPAGTLVFSFKLSVGKVGVLRREMFTNEAIAALPIRDAQRLDSDYLYHALSALDLRGIGEQAVKGITLNTQSLSRLPIVLPPKAEQRRIAAVLGRTHALCLKRRESLSLARQLLRASFLDLVGDPVANDRAWPKLALGEIAAVDRGKFTPRPRNDPRYYGGPYPFVQTGDISRSDGTIRKWHQALNEAGTAVSRSFPRGTIVMAIAANIGDTAIVDFDFYCPDSVVGIAIRSESVQPEYLEYCLRFFKDGLEAAAPKTAQRNINLQVIRPLRVPIPPIEIQARFSKMRWQATQLDERYTRGLADLERLHASLSDDAFGI